MVLNVIIPPFFFFFFWGGGIFPLKYKKILDQGYSRHESINLAKCHPCQSSSEKRAPNITAWQLNITFY